MQDFLPCTMSRSIGDGISFRPIKSWHSGTYAGEGLYKIPNSDDGSGCLCKDISPNSFQKFCPKPLTATHRLYWHERDPNKTVFAFLSYPNAMGAINEYFWKIYPASNEDVERFTGPDAEAEMETTIKCWFNGATT